MRVLVTGPDGYVGSVLALLCARRATTSWSSLPGCAHDGEDSVQSDGSSWRPPTHMHDVARAVAAPLEAHDELVRGEVFDDIGTKERIHPLRPRRRRASGRPLHAAARAQTAARDRSSPRAASVVRDGAGAACSVPDPRISSHAGSCRAGCCRLSSGQSTVRGVSVGWYEEAVRIAEARRAGNVARRDPRYEDGRPLRPHVLPSRKHEPALENLASRHFLLGRLGLGFSGAEESRGRNHTAIKRATSIAPVLL